MALRLPVNEEDHIEGNIDAPITLVEYGDYQCPHCGRAYPIVKRIQEEMGDRMRFVFRDFPLEKAHPQALVAAVASEAAGRQGKFWEMHDLLFENQRRLHHAGLVEYATALGLDIDRFEQDLNDEQLAIRVKDEFYSGMRSGVNATPTFFVNGEKFEGDWEGGELREYLRGLNTVN
jgi:protein-disulfide isomerase